MAGVKDSDVEGAGGRAQHATRTGHYTAVADAFFTCGALVSALSSYVVYEHFSAHGLCYLCAAVVSLYYTAFAAVLPMASSCAAAPSAGAAGVGATQVVPT